MPAYAKTGLSQEEAGRNQMSSSAGYVRSGGNKIAVAHNLNDNKNNIDGSRAGSEVEG